MDGTIHYQGRPDSTEAIQWSSDGEIAIAFRHFAEVLIPRYPLPSSKEPTVEISRWKVVRIKTNTFSADELPYMRPKSFRHFSIGAEQSLSHVVSLRWSGSGLAENGRCALAILTSNHVLSVWTSSDSRSDMDGWHRVLIVNSSLTDGASVNFSSAASESSLSPRACQVRNFTWSSSKVLSPIEAGHAPAIGENRAHCIAIINALGNVSVVRVTSQSTLQAAACPTWDATVIFHVGREGSVEDLDRPFSELRTPQPLSHTDLSPLSTLHWSPWVIATESNQLEMYSVLAVVRKTALSFILIFKLGRSQSTSLQSLNESFMIHEPYKSGLGWWIIDGKLSFFAIKTSTVVCFTIQHDDSVESGLQITPVKLLSFPDDWAKYSGVTSNPHDGVILVASHSSTKTKTENMLQKVSILGKETKSSIWEKQIVQRVNKFDAKFGLNGNILTKIWGLSSSPCGDYMACIFTLHPSEMLQYEQNSQARSILEISYQGPCIGGREEEIERSVNLLISTAIVHTTSLEGLHFSLIRLLRILEEEKVPLDMIHGMLKNSSTALRIIGFIDVERVHDRFLNTARTFQHKIYESDDFLNSMIHELRLAAGIMRNEGYHNQHSIARNIASTLLDFMPTQKPSHPTDISITTLSQFVAGSRTDFVTGEECSICGKSIPFESIKSAKCIIGHEFARCSMSFLSIQSPGVTRSCRICNAPYLKAQSLLEYKTFASAPVIATLLVQAVQICVFCGGKFEG